MPDLGDYASFILLAYGAATLVLVLLTGWVVSDLRSQRALLAELEARKARAATAPGKPKPRTKRVARARTSRKAARSRKR